MAKKILIVDDEPSITIPLKFLIEQNQFEVKVVHSGEDALASIDSFGPDLVLLDVMLPAADGFQVCQKLKADPTQENLKVVFISAMTRDLDKCDAVAEQEGSPSDTRSRRDFLRTGGLGLGGIAGAAALGVQTSKVQAQESRSVCGWQSLQLHAPSTCSS